MSDIHMSSSKYNTNESSCWIANLECYLTNSATMFCNRKE